MISCSGILNTMTMIVSYISGVFVFKKDLFWTLPHDFAAMRSVRPKLYSSLARSNLLIFKGKLQELFTS